jgi:photosystem II stability/assembly factor-like uncharacterized protein
MTRFLVGVFMPVFLVSVGYGQESPPFTLSWREGKCIECKTAHRLGRIQFVKRSEVWAVGFDQPLRGSFVVVHSTDAGRTWKELPQVHEYAGPDKPPAFWFLDRARGWIAWLDDRTNEFEMIHTQDAGEHWQNLSKQSLQEVRFFDDNHGYGADGANFLRTNDGGRTWTETTIPHTRYIDNMVFLTPDDGWIADADGKDLFVFRTTNGGRDWEESRTTAPEEVGEVRDMFFVDQDRGWLTTWNLDYDGSYLFSTVDGGKHWAPDPAFQGKNKKAREVRFISKERGFVFVDEVKRRSLMYTTDGGAHWSRHALPRLVHDCKVFEGDLLCGAEPPGFSLLTLHPK